MGHRFDIAVELARLCARNKDGSFATQADRVQIPVSYTHLTLPTSDLV